MLNFELKLTFLCGTLCVNFSGLKEKKVLKRFCSIFLFFFYEVYTFFSINQLSSPSFALLAHLIFIFRYLLSTTPLQRALVAVVRSSALLLSSICVNLLMKSKYTRQCLSICCASLAVAVTVVIVVVIVVNIDIDRLGTVISGQVGVTSD